MSIKEDLKEIWNSPIDSKFIEVIKDMDLNEIKRQARKNIDKRIKNV